MTHVFTGEQIQQFLADPAFWGRGQSYRDLELRVNGASIGAAQFDQDWDPMDLGPGDQVEILAGVWVPRGDELPSRLMRDVIQYWAKGQKPVFANPRVEPAKASVQRPAFASKGSKPAEEKELVLAQEDVKPQVERPSFRI